MLTPDPRFLQMAKNLTADGRLYDEFAERLDFACAEERAFVITELQKLDEPEAVEIYDALCWRYSA